MTALTTVTDETFAVWADELQCPVCHAMDEGCDPVVCRGLDAD
ncbi:MAG: hypothetical protein U0Q15_07025 [Kineosporiaceae bacterium]